MMIKINDINLNASPVKVQVWNITAFNTSIIKCKYYKKYKNINS